MFTTYFCKDGTIVDIDEFSDRESAEKAVQSYYEDDLDQGEWEDGVYGVRDGVWEAVRDHLAETGRVGEGNTDFLILHVVGFGEGWQQITGEVEF